MQGDIDQVLISRQAIARRVRELAGQITQDYQADSRITILPVMTGAMIFCADLIREIPMNMEIGLITVSSYPGKSVASQGAQVIGQQLGDIAGRHVLIVDDILDTGTTLGLVKSVLEEKRAAGVRTCVLLRKDRPSARSFVAEYVGFDIPDAFVVGYGLDFNNRYRNLPDIVTLKREVLAQP